MLFGSWSGSITGTLNVLCVVILVAGTPICLFDTLQRVLINLYVRYLVRHNRQSLVIAVDGHGKEETEVWKS